MSQDILPPEILVTELPDGVRFDLPSRKPGGSRSAGSIIFTIGLVIVVVGLLLTVTAFISLLKSPNTFNLISIIFRAFFSLPVLLFGGVALTAGILLSKGRSRIELTSTELLDIEQAGPLHWTFRRPAADIQKLEVRVAPANSLSDMSAILIHSRGNPRPMVVAYNYPMDLLRPLADDLALRLSALTAAPARPPVEVAVNTQPFNLLDSAPAELDIPITQPANSKVLVDRNPAGITLTIPPAGLLGGAKALAIFCVIWLAACLFFTAVLIATRSAFPAFLFIIPFWLVGVSLVLLMLNMARRSAIVDVVGPTLVITQSGLFKTRQQEWPAADIADVRSGPSGMLINNRPVLCLQIKLATGKTRDLFTARNEPELAWLAYEIRQALKA